MAVQETDGKQTAMRIDMNSDMGESFGRWTLGDDEALLGLHTIGVGDGGNEIGMGRVEDYAIEGVVDHGENIACTVPTDQLVVAGTSNWGAHALVCAMRALGSNAVDPYLEPTWQERMLDVIVEYGGLDGVHMTNVATVDGLEPDRYFKQVGQLTDCARS